MSTPGPQVPPHILEFAERAVEYVQRALGLPLAYDSDTLSLLDHYLATVPRDAPATVELVISTAGAYFGEVVRRRLGGRWASTDEGVAAWRVVLPTGLELSPAGMVAAAIARADVAELETELDAPARIRPHLVEALARMGEITEDEYYSLCGRLDTLEHVHEVLVGVAAHLLGSEPADAEADADADADAPAEPDGDDPAAN